MKLGLLILAFHLFISVGQAGWYLKVLLPDKAEKTYVLPSEPFLVPIKFQNGMKCLVSAIETGKQTESRDLACSVEKHRIQSGTTIAPKVQTYSGTHFWIDDYSFLLGWD